MKRDIESVEDIQFLVNTFYEEAKKDELLGPIFMREVEDWDKHLDKMKRFWQSLLMDEVTYQGQSFEPHKKLDIDKRHFDRWIGLWAKIVDENFEGELADQAKYRSEKIGAVYLYKLEYLKEQGLNP